MRIPKPSRRGQEGVSLLESLAAISLFAIVAAGVATMAGASMRHTANNRQSTAAQMLAQEELERVRGLDYPDIDDGSVTRTMAGKSYDIATTVLDNTPANGMKRITVTVTWDGPMGERSYAIDTIFTDVN